VLALYAIAVWFSVAAVLMAISNFTSGMLIALITLSAAYVGIRTLGYLDLNLPMLPRTNKEGSAEARPNETEISLNELSLRQHQVHYDAVQNDRALPVGFAETRGPWRRDTDIFQELAKSARKAKTKTRSKGQQDSLVFDILPSDNGERRHALEGKNGATNGQGQSDGYSKEQNGGQKNGHAGDLSR